MADPTSRPKAELAAAVLKAPPEPAVTEYFVPNFVANADLLALRPTPKPQAAVALVPAPRPTPKPQAAVALVPAPPSGSGPTEQHWAQLRRCESGNNYSVISSNGLWYGAYQFTLGTWDSVANRIGRTDLVGVLPSAAAPGDQGIMAKALYADRGWQPWPPAVRMFNQFGWGVWERCVSPS